MNKFTIEFYEKKNGEQPAKEFILNSDAKMKAKILKILDLLEIYRMNEYGQFKQTLLQDPEVKAEYDALEPEFDIIRTMIKARKEQNITQKELSERTGITQADISRIENGSRNPSLDMLKRLAKGLGMRLKLEFVPESKKRP